MAEQDFSHNTRSSNETKVLASGGGGRRLRSCGSRLVVLRKKLPRKQIRLKPWCEQRAPHHGVESHVAAEIAITHSGFQNLDAKPENESTSIALQGGKSKLQRITLQDKQSALRLWRS